MTGAWHSEPGANLLFSVMVHPKGLSASEGFVVSRMAAVALCQALGPEYRIKWPNDIFHLDRKVAGILIENELRNKHNAQSIIGCGRNVNQRTIDPTHAPTATSVSLIEGRTIDREALLRSVVHEFDCALRLVDEGQRERISESYDSRIYRLGQRQTFEDEGGRFEAVIEGVRPTGHLALRLAESGERRRYAFKEVKYIIG